MKLIVCLLILCSVCFADKKERDWKTGKVLDSNSEKITTHGGSSTQGRINDDGTYSGTTTQSSWNHKKFTFVIEGEDYTYVVSHVLSFRWSKEVQLTINGPVKYAVEKSSLYLIDENSREFKLKIEKKILREKPAPGAARSPFPNLSLPRPVFR